MTWTFQPVTAFDGPTTDAWQEANRRWQGAHPLLDIKFVGPLVEHFGHPGLRLAIETVGGEPRSAAICERARPGVWQLFLPSQAQIAPAVFGPPGADDEGASRFRTWFAQFPGLPLVVGLQNQDAAYSGVAHIHSELAELLPHVTTVGITMDGDFDTYWRARSAKLRENLARHLRKLDRDGFVPRLVAKTACTEMKAAVGAHGDLESAGWKAGSGTAIHRDNAQGRFYTGVMERFAAAGSARAFQLYFNDTLAASQLTIEQNGMMVLLKTAHAEPFSRHSPGRLLDYLMLRDLFAGTPRRPRVIEFYTSASREDTRWATFSREIVHVNVYRSRLARRALQALRQLRSRPSAATPETAGNQIKAA